MNEYDKREKLVQYEVRYKILLNVKVIALGQNKESKKLSPKFQGPYTSYCNKSRRVWKKFDITFEPKQVGEGLSNTDANEIVSMSLA